MDAYREVEKLLAQIRAVSSNPVVERTSDQIQVICAAYMEPGTESEAVKCGLRGKRAAMFNLLHKKQGQIVSRQALMTTCYGLGDEPDSAEGSLRVQMVTVRRAAKRCGYWIENIHGTGYKLQKLAA